MSTSDPHTEVVAADQNAAGEPDEAAAERIAELLEPQRIDALLADAEASGISIDGPDGLISKMIKAVLERGLDTGLVEFRPPEAPHIVMPDE